MLHHNGTLQGVDISSLSPREGMVRSEMIVLQYFNVGNTGVPMLQALLLVISRQQRMTMLSSTNFFHQSLPGQTIQH